MEIKVGDFLSKRCCKFQWQAVPATNSKRNQRY